MKKGYMLFLSALILFISAALHQAGAQVKINEFLAHNIWTNADMVDYDDFSDWVELYNEGSSAADIGGYYLTGNLKNPKKSQIPSGTSIPAKGYLFFWCDGNNAKPGTKIAKTSQSSTTAAGFSSTTTKYYHAGFKLDKDGEQLGLFDASGKVIDSITYGQQLMDVSMGRNPTDGSWCYFDQPTPGAANSTPAKKTQQRSGTVTFSVDAGFSSSGQSVALTSSDNSPIYYTTDGSIPNASSTKYSSPISVSANTVIRGRTITSDKIAGLVATNTYFKESLRKLMVIEMTTDQTFLDDPTTGIFKKYHKYREVPVVFECFGTDGKPAVRFNGAIQVGSLTNYSCPQKPLQVELKPKYGTEFVNYRFFGKPITKFNRLRLRQGGDAWNSNLIADDLLDPISFGQMSYGWQAYKPVVTYINGKYNGIMDLREQFRNEYFKQNFGCDTTGMQEVRRLLNSSGMGEGWETVHGSKSNWDQVASGSTNYENTKAKVDINSMIDYYVIEGFSCNVSWGHNEDMFWVPNAKWRWLTTDIDRDWEYKGTYSDVTTDIIHKKGGGLSGAFIVQSEIFGNLMKNTEFKNHFCQRYMAHMNSTLKASRLTRIIDSLKAMLTPEMAANTSKWGSQGGVKSVSAWNSELDNMKKFCNERGAYEITHLSTDMTGGTAKLTINVTNPKAGDIYIEGVRMCEGTSEMTFFKSAPLGIKAVPKSYCADCKFKGWGSGGSGDSLTITLNGDQTATAAFEGNPPDAAMPSIAPVLGFSCSERISQASGRFMLSIEVSTPEPEQIRITLYNVTGRKLGATDSEIGPGVHPIHMSLNRLAPGIYFYRIQTKSMDMLNKITLRY